MIKKVLLAATAAVMISMLASCAQSGTNNQDNNTQKPSGQPAEQTTQQQKPADNAASAPKDTNKKYMCVNCNDYFDQPGDCSKCGMELVENYDYTE
ncbi:MAG: hypothetical protein IKS00_01525 [Bacteroidales bacterium]|nr:hypothetical protein [Bacteroidales bacterium]